jgi:hypothetical protein
VELFQQTGGIPLDTGRFQASAARWRRVRSQLQISHQLTNVVIGFSVPDYMSPMGVNGAEQLYSDYLREIRNSDAARIAVPGQP